MQDNTHRLISAIAMSVFPVIALVSDAKEATMQAMGTFDVNLEPQDDAPFSAGRMLITKTYSGDLEGEGVGQMISKRTASGHAVYYAVEEISGKLGDRSGSFTLLHEGTMSADGQSLTVKVMPGSGRGDLESLTGTLEITQSDGEHRYSFDYSL